MVTATARVIVPNELGMHARSATAFAAIADRYECVVTVIRTDTTTPANGKSVLSLLQLIVLCGTEIEIRAEGHDAQHAVDELLRLVQAGFGEM